MKEIYEEHRQRSGGVEGLHSARQHIFQEALQRWESRSPTSQKRKRDLAQQAKAINAEANVARAERMRVKAEKDGELAADAKAITKLQKQAFHVACSAGLLTGGVDAVCDAAAPSTLKPLALASHEAAREVPPLPLPLTDQAADSEDPSASTSDNAVQKLDQYIQSRQGQALLDLVDSQHTSLHGLGDHDFPISEAILELAAQRKGFVQEGHRQLNREFGSICAKLPTAFVIDEQLSVDHGLKSCGQLLGRYCRRDIVDRAKYDAAVSMMRNLVRILMSLRTVKSGNTMHLGMDQPWPVIIIEDGTSMFPFLSYRVSFNPYEIDFIHCKAEPYEPEGMEVDAAFRPLRLHLLFETVATTNRRLPVSSTMRELAVWYSQLAGSDWTCRLFTKYELSESRPMTLILRAAHQASTSRIGTFSFEGLVPEHPRAKTASQGKDSEAPEEFDFLRQLMQRMGGKSKSTTAGHKQAATRVNQLPGGSLVGVATSCLC